LHQSSLSLGAYVKLELKPHASLIIQSSGTCAQTPVAIANSCAMLSSCYFVRAAHSHIL